MAARSGVTRRPSYLERRWPESDDFIRLAVKWGENASAQLLTYVWVAYDALAAEVFAVDPPTGDDESLERSITQLLEPRIRAAMTGWEPFQVQHGPYEYETRSRAPAQPPAYDIAFFLVARPRLMWPLEAKVLRTDRAVALYVAAVRNEFLTCRSSPFSSQAGMLGYLVAGNPQRAFAAIERATRYRLAAHPHFHDRPHRISDHVRKVPQGKP
ncbi:MAG: hypothetical protein AUI36_46555, partial [Cyanobacteria bacterium 13_1_40CM_2_61_4]